MITVKVTSRGQVTIPREVRERLGVRPGETVGFEERDGMVVISKVVTKSPFDKWVGHLGHLKGRRSDDLSGRPAEIADYRLQIPHPAVR